jgi:hypothetical protein
MVAERFLNTEGRPLIYISHIIRKKSIPVAALSGDAESGRIHYARILLSMKRLVVITLLAEPVISTLLVYRCP